MPPGTLKQSTQPTSGLPRHIAIIMDGNGRWAKSKGRLRVFGHENGVESLRQATTTCAELGIEYLTVYAFSTENWNRPAAEVNALMNLLIRSLKAELPTLNKNQIKLNAIGDLKSLPGDCQESLDYVIDATRNNTRMTLTLALSYSARDEIIRAIRTLAHKAAQGHILPQDITEQTISDHLDTHNMPDPDLLIRTSGEYRISNYLLWQIAYSELYFSNKFWPEFRREDLMEALADYQKRERRFGKTGEQVKA